MALRLKVFEDEGVGLNGLLYKAGLTTKDADVNGTGVGIDQTTWLSDAAGSGFTVTNGGWLKTATESDSANYIKVAPPTAYRSQLASRGSFQFDMYLSDLTVKTLLNKYFIQSGEAGTYALGVVSKFNYTSGTAGYNQVTKDLNDAEALISAVSLTTTSDLVDNTKHALPVIILHDGVDTSAGYITFGMSWTVEWLDTYINGTLVSRARRKPGNVEAMISMTELKMQLNVAVAQKNFLLYDRPFEDVMRSDLRVVNVGHSFMSRDYLTRTDDIGTPATTVGFAGVEMIGSQLMKNIDKNIDYRVLAFSGNTMTDFINRIEGASFSYVIGAGTYLNPVTRARPHFCIVCGYSNGTGATYANITAGVDGISAALIALGVIPIWVNEQNRDQAAAPADNTVNNTTYVAAVTAQQVANDMGMADIWNESGGSAVDASWIESGDANQFHPNMKALGYYGAAIAAEINRLILDPPSYSNLAKLDS